MQQMPYIKQQHMQWVKYLLQHQAAVNDIPATYAESVVLLQAAAADPSAPPSG
jgi:hypothetical protein